MLASSDSAETSRRMNSSYPNSVAVIEEITRAPSSGGSSCFSTAVCTCLIRRPPSCHFGSIAGPNSFGFIEANCWTKEPCTVPAIKQPPWVVGEQVHPQLANGTPARQTKPSTLFEPFSRQRLANGPSACRTKEAALSEPFGHPPRGCAARSRGSSGRVPNPDSSSPKLGPANTTLSAGACGEPNAKLLLNTARPGVPDASPRARARTSATVAQASVGFLTAATSVLVLVRVAADCSKLQ